MLSRFCVFLGIYLTLSNDEKLKENLKSTCISLSIGAMHKYRDMPSSAHWESHKQWHIVGCEDFLWKKKTIM